MPNAVSTLLDATTEAARRPVRPLQLSASMRRLLADPYTAGDDVPAWSPPARLPEARVLTEAVREIERALRPATAAHMRWCVHKLFVLPTAGSDTTSAALMADNFIDACGHLPDDLWSAGTLELLQTKSFRPTPAELLRTVDRKLAERRRMLGRAKGLLAAKPAAAPFVPEPEEVRLKATIDRWKRHEGSFLAPMLQRSAERAERRLAELAATRAAAQPDSSA